MAYGAGKTTLMNVLSSLSRADRGDIRIDGHSVSIRAPDVALRHGIWRVHQHVELIPTFPAMEDVLLGREGSRWWLHPGRHRAAVAGGGARFGLDLDLRAQMRHLPIGVQQKVELLKMSTGE
jgi:simple sugar transport system ATP-binding protein